MGWDYSEKTKQLFMDAVHGKPGTHMGEIENPDGLGEHGAIACGDAMRFTFRVKRDSDDPMRDIITEARYLTFGCTSAIAASEALCHMIEDRELTPVEALSVSNQDIVDYLDGLPDQKIHCSVMGAEALEAAVFNWAQKRGVNLDALGVDVHEDEIDEGRIVCKCFNMTEPYLRRKITELGLKTIPEITHAVKAGGACMACHHRPGGLQDLLDEIWGRTKTVIKKDPELPASNTTDVEPANDSGMSSYQRMKLIEQAMDGYIRPMLARDGGDAEIVDIKQALVYIRLKGACASCAGAQSTLKLLVEKTLKEQVDEAIKVIAV
jgi:NifU-like protein